MSGCNMHSVGISSIDILPNGTHTQPQRVLRCDDSNSGHAAQSTPLFDTDDDDDGVKRPSSHV